MGFTGTVPVATPPELLLPLGAERGGGATGETTKSPEPLTTGETSDSTAGGGFKAGMMTTAIALLKDPATTGDDGGASHLALTVARSSSRIDAPPEHMRLSVSRPSTPVPAPPDLELGLFNTDMAQKQLPAQERQRELCATTS